MPTSIQYGSAAMRYFRVSTDLLGRCAAGSMPFHVNLMGLTS
ncbi:hypothetical protein BZL30_6241 [Mycobacterium kansasii]|uniref:Uncharacterized protein n=1 Tax=Mycobacterium kansasii TaxID=1768 RepID=A0A1V3WUF6_MYCKA|nr:hypothetical protein BZL30_6241 [Mycobacterium kansasii]